MQFVGATIIFSSRVSPDGTVVAAALRARQSAAYRRRDVATWLAVGAGLASDKSDLIGGLRLLEGVGGFDLAIRGIHTSKQCGQIAPGRLKWIRASTGCGASVRYAPTAGCEELVETGLDFVGGPTCYGEAVEAGGDALLGDIAEPVKPSSEVFRELDSAWISPISLFFGAVR